MTCPNIKIFVSCHKNCNVPENNIFYPIHVGAGLHNKQLPDMLRDDTGDNISYKNKSYCELTAQYWAWKNIDADYYGFFHYRRYLSFAENKFKANTFGDIVEDFNDKETLEKYGIDEKTMSDTIKNYDIVMPFEGGFAEKKLTIYKQYEIAHNHYKSDLDFVLNIVKRDYPEMAKYADEYFNGTKGYFCNMFIMKKDIFKKYSQWLFGILQEHEMTVDISNYSQQAYRVHGFLAERLCGLYLYYLEKTTDLKILKLQRLFFNNVEKEEEFLPAFAQNNISVVLSANDYYVPYLSTILQSLKDNSSTQFNYDIIVLNTDISEKNQKILKEQVFSKNISLRFFNVARQMNKYKNLPLRGHFKVETYFRILMPELLPHYDKILYLDSDMVILTDVSTLYNTELDGFLLAACRDADTAGLYNGFEPNKKNYMDNILKIKNPYSYFQAGTILFNLNEFRKTYSVKEIMDFATSYQWELLDQDVLNYIAQDKTKYVDMSWNVMMDWQEIRINQIIGRAPIYLYEEYMQARKTPKIVHYAGPDKPWEIPYSDFATYFWQYARKTPYYEIIMQRMLAVQLNINSKKNKKGLKKKLSPIVNVFFPVGTKRREKLKKLIGHK